MKENTPPILFGKTSGHPFNAEFKEGDVTHTFAFGATRNGMIFNPMAAAVDEAGKGWLIDFFAKQANVELSPESRAGYLGVIESLPQGASLADFVRAATQYEADALGLSVETYTALSPLLMALAQAQQKADGIDVPGRDN